VLCGGSYGMSGAPTLAARAVLRAGGGLCIACLAEKVLPLFAAVFSEATSVPLPCDDNGALIPGAADALAAQWEKADAVALGPGLSRSAGALDFARRVLRECPQPLVVDADALYAVRAIEKEVAARSAPTVLTPHPGEMGELMDMKVAELQQDRLGVAAACAKRYNAVVVLKGSRSVVATPGGRLYINLTGNSGMATGGSGDVLTGTIAGLIAQLKDTQAATLLGVYLHGLAGDLAHATKGNGLIAGDIAEQLPAALVGLEREPPPSINARLTRLE
jgi:NAD(P)H-hydrate epimerase